MEETSSDAPQLTVETENVRRNSNAASDIKCVQPPFEAESSAKVRASVSNSSPEVLSDVKNEASIKRVDSDSKFGFMETVPLELSMQETPPCSPAPNITVGNSESVSVQMRSLSLTEKILPGPTDATIRQRPRSTADCEENALSKYFQMDPMQQEKNDTAGLNFFDALAVNTPNAASTKQEVVAPIVVEKDTDPFKGIGGNENKETLQESSREKDESNPTPALLKFFSEDKSGKDHDGRAFFDKIAEVKNTMNPIILQMKEPLTQAEEFLSSLELSGEIEEAWIPSEKTRHTLVSILTSNVPFSPDKNQLTMPGILVEQDMVDSVKALLHECNSPYALNRKTLNENNVSEDEAGLQKLMEAGCYNAALNLTKRLLKTCGQGVGEENKTTKHTPLSLRLWYVRLALFVKLQQYSYAEVESAAFGDLDKPDLYYEFYPDTYKGKQGTMVPFSFRLLLAELPQYLENYQVAMDNMYQVLNVIQKMIKNIKNGCAEDGTMRELSESRQSASLEIWGRRERRVLYSILNCVLAQKDYTLAVSITRILIEKSNEDGPQLHSALGRIYLQLGDVKYAQECFTKAATLAQNMEQFLAEEKINKALLAIALNNNEDAFKYYEQAFSICPKNAMLANNMAVCLLYMGRLKESLTLLEKTIHNNPSSCLHDGLLFNICTLYELESSRCAQKKLAMLELVSKHVGDAFNVSCLKIQSVPAKA